MAIPFFLAMTAAEIDGIEVPNQKIAWMACRFSPWSRGLSNLPRQLPEGSLLILSDAVPMEGHDPSIIGAQLRQCVERFRCAGLLLDLERPWSEDAANLAAFLVSALPCPVGVPGVYGKEVSSPVFLPPVPHHIPLTEYLSPWQGREIWLDLAPDAEIIRLTPEGAQITPLPQADALDTDFFDVELLCHYRQQIRDEEAAFTLHRTWEDLQQLLTEAENHGVTRAVGLYQEFYLRSSAQFSLI